MKLYCYDCCETHELLDDQIEHIVYALQGHLADARFLPSEGPHLQIDCLLDVLESAHDVEGYAEHVAARIRGRKEYEREIEAQLAEADR